MDDLLSQTSGQRSVDDHNHESYHNHENHPGPTYRNSQGEELEIFISSTAEQPPEKANAEVISLDSLDDRWRHCLRDDLNCIPLAREYGWQPKFSYIDIMYRRLTPGNIPHDTLSFSKGNKVCWKVYSIVKETNGIFRPLYEAWRIADFINGVYTNHRTYEFLKDILMKE